MKQITMYEANDGALFKTEFLALAHEKRRQLAIAYDLDPIYTDTGSKVHFGDFIKWCKDSENLMAQIMVVVSGELK